MTPEKTVTDELDIKVTVTESGDVRRTMAVEIGAADVAVEYERACRKYARTLKVPGFRAGRVPPHIIKQRFGREIEKETVEHAIRSAMRQAIRGLDPRPIATPSLKQYEYRPDAPLSFTAEYEILPRFTVQGASEVRVQPAVPQVTDRMRSETLDALRERAANLVPVEDRGVAPGDHVVMDVTAVDTAGTPVLQRRNLLIEIGSGGPHPELTEPMRDMKPPEVRRFKVDYPPDHPSEEVRGRSLDFEVTLREIKVKVLPDLDDEFARGLGKFETLEELKNKIDGDLLAREQRRARDAARGEAIEQLLRHNPGITVPDRLIDEEVELRVRDMARSLAMQGMDPASANIDWDDIRQKQRDPAERSVRATMILDALAGEKKVSLEPGELDAAIAEEAERRRQTAESLRAQMTKDGRLENLSEHLVRQKVLDFLIGPSNT